MSQTGSDQQKTDDSPLLENCVKCGTELTALSRPLGKAGKLNLCSACLVEFRKAKATPEWVPVVTRNPPLDFTLYHVVNFETDYPFIGPIEDRWTYRATQVRLSPLPRRPDRHKYSTTVKCPVCQSDVTLTVVQQTFRVVTPADLADKSGPHHRDQIVHRVFKRVLAQYWWVFGIGLFLPVFLMVTLLTARLAVPASLAMVILVVLSSWAYVKSRMRDIQGLCFSVRPGSTKGYDSIHAYGAADKQCFSVITEIRSEDEKHLADRTHHGLGACFEVSDLEKTYDLPRRMWWFHSRFGGD